MPTAALTHIGALVLGIYGVRILGWPRGAAWKAAAAYLALWAVTRLATPASANINLAFRVYPGWESRFPSYPLYFGTLFSLGARHVRDWRFPLQDDPGSRVPRAGGRMSTTVAQYARHVDPAFVKLLGVLGYGRVFTRASGVRVWDDQGREYLDLLAGFGSANIGHNHPRLVARLHALLDEQPLNLSHTGPSPHAARLAEALAAEAGGGLDMSLFCTGGAEAVEAAIKAARAATGRTRIVFCEGAYHGLSLGALSVSGSKRMRRPFEPLLPSCEAIPFADANALERVLARRDAAMFLVEPVQIEGGIRFAPPEFLRQARALCTTYGSLLALDEVQTGIGRTGSLFAFQQAGVVPDLLILGKSLGGSIAAVSRDDDHA